MIRSLKDTTEKNTEQDWLKTNLARFTRLLQGQREMLTVCKLILSELAPLVKAQHGVFYGMEGEKDDARLGLQASYAYKERKNLSKQFRLGEGLVGECALEKAAHPAHQRAERLCADQLRPWGSYAHERRGAAGTVRRGDQSRHRVGVLRAFQPHPSRLPGTVHREHRHRAPTPSRPIRAPKHCCSSRKTWRWSCKPSGKSCSRPTTSWRAPKSVAGKGQPREIGFPFRHEPRAAHASQCHHWLLHSCPEDRPLPKQHDYVRKISDSGVSLSGSSMASSTSPRSKPASWRWSRPCSGWTMRFQAS